MGNQLLIRAYNVEVGDCFYVRIPGARVLGDERDDFHLLIDCGTKGGQDLVRDAIARLADELPESSTPGKKRLDLLLVTHEHQDHIKGFDPEAFQDVLIGEIWMSAAMNPEHRQAERSRELHDFASRAMREIESLHLALSPEMRDLVSLFSIDNDGALDALRNVFPNASGAQVRYVHAGMSAEDFAVPIEGAALRVLGPQEDIDHFYLGKEADQTLHSLMAANATFAGDSVLAAADAYAGAYPENISAADFERLRSRMVSNAFAFAELDSKIKNNTSLVLLIEWQGRRLLFVGDAEWEDRFSEGRHNGGWNVLWNEQRDDLDAPVDFLKIGHHGSTNSTPWSEERLDENSEPVQILNAILPRPADGEEASAKALVSTRRKNYKTIPRSALLAEIGQRVGNTLRYRDALEAQGIDPRELRHYEELEAPWLAEPQPPRTDLEELLTGQGFVEVTLDPAD